MRPAPSAVRWTAPLLALLLATSAAAQDVVPDTTAPERYYPLAVGNRWEYHVGFPHTPGATHRRNTVVADTAIGGERWFVERVQGFRESSEGEGWDRVYDRRRAVRFDPDQAGLVVWADGGAEPVYPCRFDLPVPPASDLVRSCDGNGQPPFYSKRAGSVRVGRDEIDTVVLGFDGVIVGPVLAAGIGDTGGLCEGECGAGLVYAHVGGQTYGAPVEGIPYVPDLTPPASYYPLGIGDQWVYSQFNVIFHGYTRRTVLRDSVVGDRTYAVVESAAYDLRAEVPAWERTDPRLLRFDLETTDIVERLADGREFVVIPDLGADFFGCPAAPFGEGCEYYFETYPGEPITIRIGEEEVSVPSIKLPNGGASDPWPPGFAAGIGKLGWGGAWNEQLEYVRVAGSEFGSKPVAGEDGPEAPTLALAVAPNPTAGPLAVAFDLAAPSVVTAEAFDALGRRVWRRETALGAGRQRLALDAGAWAPGLYVVRVAAGDETATARVVRR